MKLLLNFLSLSLTFLLVLVLSFTSCQKENINEQNSKVETQSSSIDEELDNVNYQKQFKKRKNLYYYYLDRSGKLEYVKSEESSSKIPSDGIYLDYNIEPGFVTKTEDSEKLIQPNETFYQIPEINSYFEKLNLQYYGIKKPDFEKILRDEKQYTLVALNVYGVLGAFPFPNEILQALRPEVVTVGCLCEFYDSDTGPYPECINGSTGGIFICSSYGCQQCSMLVGSEQ